mgnify:CR=1 FL=1
MTNRTLLIGLLSLVACGDDTSGSGGAGGVAQTSSVATTSASTTVPTGGSGGGQACLPSGTLCEVPETQCAARCCSGMVEPVGGFAIASGGSSTIYACE